MPGHTSHITRQTSYVTHHTLQVTRHTSHLIHVLAPIIQSPLIQTVLHITRCTSQRSTSHVARHTSHVTHHTLHITRHPHLFHRNAMPPLVGGSRHMRANCHNFPLQLLHTHNAAARCKSTHSHATYILTVTFSHWLIMALMASATA